MKPLNITLLLSDRLDSPHKCSVAFELSYEDSVFNDLLEDSVKFGQWADMPVEAPVFPAPRIYCEYRGKLAWLPADHIARRLWTDTGFSEGISGFIGLHNWQVSEALLLFDANLRVYLYLH